MAALRHSATAAAAATPPSDAAACEFAFSDFDFQRLANLERFTRQIKPGGFLDIGRSESLVGSRPGLDLVGRTTYRRSA